MPEYDWGRKWLDVEEGRRGREKPNRAASKRGEWGQKEGVVGRERSIYMEGMAVIK